MKPLSQEILITGFSLLLSFFVLFLKNEIGKSEAKKASEVLQLIINKQADTQDSFQISKNLEILETMGVVKCTRLNQLSPTVVTFFDNQTKEECLSQNKYMSRTMTTRGGVKWNFNFIIPNTLHLEIISYLIVTFIWFTSFFLMYIRHKENALKKKLATIRNEYLHLIRHDLQSPLSTLKTFIESNETSDVIQGVIDRIEAMIHSIDMSEESKSIKTLSLISLIQSIIDEKLLEHKLPSNTFKLSFNTSPNDFFIDADASNFKRVLSNLINNSIEAHDKKNELRISFNLTKFQKQVEIIYSDNCGGFPSDILKLQGSEIFSTKGKKRGYGLKSLFNFVKSHGDCLELKNHSSGATIVFRLYCSLRVIPKYYFSNKMALDFDFINTNLLCHLKIKKPEIIVLIDDDKYVANDWKNLCHTNNILFYYFKTPQDFLNFNFPIEKHPTLFIDYYLEEMNGVEFAKKLNFMGYTDLWITTGKKDNFPIESFINGIISKRLVI